MRRYLLSFVIASTAIFASAAAAQPLMTYTYADVAYQWTSINEDGYDNANGVDVRLSASPIEHFALEGGYNYATTGLNLALPDERLSFDVDSNVFTYGGAGWYTIAEGLDLVGRVGGIHARASLSGYGVDETASDNGVYAGLSLRYLATEDLETDLNVLYDRIEDGAWTYGLTGLYAVHEHVALKAEAAIDNDADVGLLAGVRLAL